MPILYKYGIFFHWFYSSGITDKNLREFDSIRYQTTDIKNVCIGLQF